MKVLLADDESRVRSALRLLIEQDPEIRVIGEVGRLAELSSQILGNRPDVVMIDWELPGLKDELLNTEIRELCKNIKVIVISGRVEEQQAAIAAGADMFISKIDPPECVMKALRQFLSSPWIPAG